DEAAGASVARATMRSVNHVVRVAAAVPVAVIRLDEAAGASVARATMRSADRAAPVAPAVRVAVNRLDEAADSAARETMLAANRAVRVAAAVASSAALMALQNRPPRDVAAPPVETVARSDGPETMTPVRRAGRGVAPVGLVGPSGVVVADWVAQAGVARGS